MIPERLVPRFARLLRRSQAAYAVLSRTPAILLVQVYQDTLPDLLDSFELLFRGLRGRPLHLLCGHGAMDDLLLEQSLKVQVECASAFPDVQFYHLCNEEKSLPEWRRHGLRAIHSNHNALVDERIFHPLPGVTRRFHAVYDARLVPLKRHWLAAQISDLALLYYVVPLVDDMAYAEKVRHDFDGAHYFNLESGAYQVLAPPAINECLNRCRTGLCLSEAEGPMYASIQYLLSGLGVVSTVSRGGRDCFWNSQTVVVVEPTAEAVRAGVDQLLARRLDPWEVHQTTLSLMQDHRRRFVDLVQSIWDGHGLQRDFQAEWPEIFFHRLTRNQNHLDTLKLLCDAERRP